MVLVLRGRKVKQIGRRVGAHLLAVQSVCSVQRHPDPQIAGGGRAGSSEGESQVLDDGTALQRGVCGDERAQPLGAARQVERRGAAAACEVRRQPGAGVPLPGTARAAPTYARTHPQEDCGGCGAATGGGLPSTPQRPRIAPRGARAPPLPPYLEAA